MLRHHSLGPAELVALIEAWRPHPTAREPRLGRVIAFDASNDAEEDAAHAGAPSGEDRSGRP